MDTKQEAQIIKAKLLATQGKLFAPASFLNSPITVLMEICNGCGAANAKFDFVPDKIYGTYIGYACHIHDFMYNEGRTVEDKDEADRVMRNNMVRIIDTQSHKWWKPTALMRRRASKYYWAVQEWGGPAFWAGKNI